MRPADVLRGRFARRGPRHVARALMVAVAFVCVASVASAQGSNPRVGRWRLKSDAPPPSSNIMTYEAFGPAGMRVTIESTNARGESSKWWYTTNFDGADMPVTGNAGQTHASVRVIGDRVNEIVNKKDGRVTQRLTNVLSPDGSTIGVMYMREDEQGRTTAVSFATYGSCRRSSHAQLPLAFKKPRANGTVRRTSGTRSRVEGYRTGAAGPCSIKARMVRRNRSATLSAAASLTRSCDSSESTR